MNIKQQIKSNIRFLIWKIRNPFQPYYKFYVDNVNKTLLSCSHPTLGLNIKDKTKFTTTGIIEKDFLIEHGLKPEHCLIDYGCGSLRIGIPLIPYLNTNNYIGLDVTKDFYTLGLSHLSKNIFANKRPQFFLISSEILETYKNSADFIVSFQVLIHIPKEELQNYFENILRLLKKTGKAFIDFRSSEPSRKVAMSTWHYSRDLIEQMVTKAGASFQFHQVSGNTNYYSENQVIVEISHS